MTEKLASAIDEYDHDVYMYSQSCQECGYHKPVVNLYYDHDASVFLCDQCLLKLSTWLKEEISDNKWRGGENE